MIVVRFDYWEVRGNELLHHHGFLANLERLSAPNLRMEKEINDIFEFLLLKSGRLIIYTSNDRQPIVLDNVPFIDKKEAAVMRMLGALQVQVRRDDGEIGKIRRTAKRIRNPKHEIRDQGKCPIRNPRNEIQNGRFRAFEFSALNLFRISTFVFRISFVIRISPFRRKISPPRRTPFPAGSLMISRSLRPRAASRYAAEHSTSARSSVSAIHSSRALPRFDQPDRPQGRLQHLAVGFVVQRRHAGRDVAAGERVQARGPRVHVAEQLRAAEFGHAQADGVAVGLRRQAAEADPLHLGRLAGDGLVVVELAAHDVRIEAHAADVLAHAVDHQHVDRVERQAGHPLAGQGEQLRLAGFELRRLDGLDQGRFVVGVFHDRQSRHDAALLA